MVASMPRLGYGTYKLDDRETCLEGVTTAIETGYRHVDTAQGYDNEAWVGEGIAEADVDPDELFVATKLSTGNLAREDVLRTARESRERLGVDRIDLLYVHWPLNTYDPAETLPALDQLVEEGVIGHVGLSNFRPDQLDEARDRLENPIFAHQVECHPLLQQRELREYAIEHDHWLVAYSPVARMAVEDVPAVRAVAEAHAVSPAQVSLAWLRSKERVAAIPKAATPAHIRENYDVRDLSLDPDELARLDDIDREHRVVDFEDAPWNQ